VFLEPCNAVISVLRVQIYGKFFIPAKLLHKKIKKIIFAPMKRVRNIAVIALFTLIYGVAGAQVKFSELSHDFGEIAEDGGKVEHIFKFRNISTKPVVIVSAHSSCGCTKAEYSRRPVMPDSTATIKVVFNPMNYPGTFARKITIVTAEGALEERLLVTGRVIPRKKTIEEEYPIVMGGGVRVATNAHSFGYLEHGKMKQSAFELYNGSEKSVSLAIENPYSELEFYSPAEVGAGEKATINFGCLLPENSAKYGSVEYAVSLVVNGTKMQYPFTINGLAIDTREENANNCAQMIAVSENFIKFGAVKCDVAKLSHTVELRNGGNRAIEIRKLEISGTGFYADIEGGSSIEAGGARRIKVEIYPSQLPFGAVVERLRIISNDPKMPVLTIRVSAIVEK
jgi:hypothetical protein